MVWAGSSRLQCRAGSRAGVFAGTADVRADRFRVLKTLHDCLLYPLFGRATRGIYKFSKAFVIVDRVDRETSRC